MSYECSCDFEPAEFSVVTNVVARKQHRCIECRGPIFPGEKYERTAGRWEGGFAVFLTCTACAELRNWARISVPCFCWIYGELHENVREMVAGVRADVPRGFVYEWGRRMIAIERRSHGRWPRKRRHHPTPLWMHEVPRGSRVQ